MIAIRSILYESWLSLRAQGLFKLTMGLNILVIVAFASLSFDETGVSLFFGLGHADSEHITANSPLATVLYLGIFSAFIVNIWLAWIAAGLALLSTSSIFPNFVSQGAVELTLSRPVSRTTIFLAKYAGGLLFVLLQVGVFTLGAFLAAGWRVGTWDWAIFLAIPLVTLFYSYLFCVNVLVGIITRSTLTALLLTLVFWFSTFTIRTSEDLVTRFVFFQEARMEQADQEIGRAMKARDEATSGTVDRAQEHLLELQEDYDRDASALSTLKAWQGPLQIARWFVPETASTVGLLKRALDHDASATIEDLMSGRIFRDDPEGHHNADEQADARLIERENERPWWWVLGKSLLFEGVVLALAIWIFRRRDF